MYTLVSTCLYRAIRRAVKVTGSTRDFVLVTTCYCYFRHCTGGSENCSVVTVAVNVMHSRSLRTVLFEISHTITTGCFSSWQWQFIGVWTAAPHGLLRPGRQCWHSAASAFRQTSTTCILAVPRYRLNTYGRRAFSVAGPTVWNSLPDFIGTRPSVEIVSGVCLKRICSLDTSAFSALEVPDDNCAL